MADVMKVTDDNFETEVVQSDIPVLVDFSATWCGPCKQLVPIVEDLAKEYAGRAKVVAVDVDQAQQTAMQFGIMSVPTLLLFKGGQTKGQMVGVQTKATLKQRLDALLG
jgi:thioredoxin 1